MLKSSLINNPLAKRNKECLSMCLSRQAWNIQQALFIAFETIYLKCYTLTVNSTLPKMSADSVSE